MHTTNYTDAFILVAGDCPVRKAEIPEKKNGVDTIASIQYGLIHDNPYRYTSDDILFMVHMIRNRIDPGKEGDERDRFFSRGQACLRSSPLTKRYGWGIHYNSEGKIAMYAMESEEYGMYKNDPDLKILKAMRSKKAR